jgi:hypothetical protein
MLAFSTEFSNVVYLGIQTVTEYTVLRQLGTAFSSTFRIFGGLPRRLYGSVGLVEAINERSVHYRDMDKCKVAKARYNARSWLGLRRFTRS